MSTLTEVKTLVKHYLGFYLSLDDTVLAAHLDMVQDKLERQGKPLPWFLFVDDATVTATADTRKTDLPADFIIFDEEWDLVAVVDGEPFQKVKKRDQYEVADYQDEEGVPEHYILDSDAVHWYPLPDKTYTINFPHYAKSATFSATETNPWFTNFPDLIVAETVKSIALANRDQDGVRLANDLLRDAKSEFLRAVEARKANHQNYSPD